MKRTILTAALIFATVFGWYQKKPIDHSVYEAWKSVGAFTMSEDGKYTIFLVNPQEGEN